jgi:FixJ family two-component response regulator
MARAGYDPRESVAFWGDFLLNKSENPHGCVILDVRMLGPSAFDLQDVLVKLDEPLPIIFVTGSGDISTSVRSGDTDAVDFLTKPIQKEALIRAVSAALAAQGVILVEQLTGDLSPLEVSSPSPLTRYLN